MPWASRRLLRQAPRRAPTVASERPRIGGASASLDEPARVLLIDGQPGNTPFEGQAYFIEKALSASGAAHGKSPFKPEILFALEGRNGPVDFTGIRANLQDPCDTAHAAALSADEKQYRDTVIALGLKLKQTQSLQELVRDIISSPIYRARSQRSASPQSMSLGR